tara:strand:- start:758 stop:964 length:207 start_codon:yes stop_codon:yes gene_type:complete
MDEKEFKELLDTCKRLVRLFKDFESQIEGELQESRYLTLEKPLIIPPELYREICHAINQDYIDLFGIS